ncbi:hypothetical protein BJ875DRAFT_438549 [Amylocarpus encephaloides]|uniref:Uncharacterized protein n=1 Tax=Amylocarpus encephaloides TaxID=45428 RepID=A0A9P7YPF8_9HELO|nr:hypothetical protein BJ875DRAFT_438549 [Amylocarpus encephaloides]
MTLLPRGGILSGERETDSPPESWQGRDRLATTTAAPGPSPGEVGKREVVAVSPRDADDLSRERRASANAGRNQNQRRRGREERLGVAGTDGSRAEGRRISRPGNQPQLTWFRRWWEEARNTRLCPPRPPPFSSPRARKTEESIHPPAEITTPSSSRTSQMQRRTLSRTKRTAIYRRGMFRIPSSPSSALSSRHASHPISSHPLDRLISARKPRLQKYPRRGGKGGRRRLHQAHHQTKPNQTKPNPMAPGRAAPVSAKTCSILHTSCRRRARRRGDSCCHEATAGSEGRRRDVASRG